VFFDNKTVVMRGIISDIVNDEIDPMWSFLVLRHEKGSFLAAVCISEAKVDLLSFLGATVSITGTANVLPDGGKRKFKTPQLTVSSPDNIRILSSAPEDPFAVPKIPFNRHGIANFQYRSATLLSRMNRRCADGRVIAVLRNRQILMETENKQLVGAQLAAGPMPEIGSYVAVAGFPETNLFIINLARAVCKTVPSPTDGSVVTKTAAKLAPTFDMNTVLREYYGRLIRITGKVISQNSSTGHPASPIITVSCGEHIIPVDVTSCKGAEALPAYGEHPQPCELEAL
jgi:hypothetical protein